MKKINSALGIYPTRTSRVSSIDTANQSLESVVFQQGKSILDFDLNVMQDIIAKNQQRFVRSIYKSSGFLTDPNISININTGLLSINKSFVNIQGNIFTIASPSNVSGTITVQTPTSNTYTFVWLEAWYQEVVPTGASGETISSNASITETKDPIIYKYGGADTAENAIANAITDPTFGAETTRRIQFRWRVRLSTINASDVSQGFITGSSYTQSTAANSSVKAQGGRSSAFITTNSSANPYTFYRADNYSSTALVSPETLTNILSDTVYRADMQKSFLEFADNLDSSLYISGRGTDDDAQQLNTVDGRVYGLPLGVVTKSGSTYSFVSLANTIATSTQGSTVVGQTGSATLTLTAQYASGGTPNTSQSNLASGIQVTGSLSASQDILLNSYDHSGGTKSYVVVKRLSVYENGTAANPSITFEPNTTGRITGLYITTVSNTSTLSVSVSGNAIGNFFYTSSTVYGLSITGSGSLSVAGTSTLTGNVTSAGAFISSTSSAANSLPTLTSNTLFSSSNVAITGGTISSAVTLTLKNSAGAAPTATGDVQWDSTSKSLRVGFNGTTTYSYGYLGTTTPASFLGTASTITASSGSSYEVARIDHVHAQPSSYNPTAHIATHAIGGSDPFTSSHVLDATARVGVSITSSSGTATGTLIGLSGAVQKRRLNFVAGANITLSLASGQVAGSNYTFDDSWSDDFLNLTIAANVAGFQDTWSTTSGYTVVNATSMVNGTTYTIYTRGTTDFTSVGAASNMIGTIFTATGAGTGTGTVYAGKATFTPIPSSPGDTGNWGMFPVKYIVAGNNYIIGWLGTTTTAQWNTIAGTSAVSYIEGSSFTASSAVTTLDFSGYGTGLVYPSSTQQFAAHREHTHPRLDGYYTSYSTLPNDGQGTAGTTVNISRGDHTHSLPAYIARQGGLAFGFGDSPQTISNALDVSGTSTYTSLASSLYVRSSAAWAADSGARIALGGAVNATPTFTAFGGISARKASSVINEYAGYLSLWVNAGSTTALTEFFRGYDNGSIYIGRTAQSKPSDVDSIVVQGKVTAASFVVSGGSGVSVSSGGTGTTGYAVGDILYADSTTTLAKLTKPASATSLLTMTSAGVPAWASLANTGITGVGTITSGAWNGTVGASTPTTGAFTTISASGLITATGGLSGAVNGTVGAGTPTTGAFTTISASGLITATGGLSGAVNGTVGASTPAAGAFTTISASSTVSGGVAPRCFIPAGAFTSSTAAIGTEATSGQFQYTFAAGNTAYVYLVVPANYGGGACSFTIHGTTTSNLTATYGTTSAAATAFTSGTTTLTASTAYYIKLTCATSTTATLTGMSIVFGG